jgi:hypothetical protein
MGMLKPLGPSRQSFLAQGADGPPGFNVQLDPARIESQAILKGE